ncbi:MAG: homoserine dehydrogenase, partial [Oscillospiraceae bacterium]|nr:homoserine dehydrogenase [Oscillospiraceae bacterium]
MIKVAILGFGVVGSGTGEVLLMNSEKITREAGDEVELKYIVDIRDIDDPRFAKYAVKDFSVVLNDPEVTIIAETIGGAGIAYEY